MTTPRTQHHTAWANAEPTLRRLIKLAAQRRSPAAPVTVGITGPVGSGKSTLAARLGGVLLATDHYLPDYQDLPEPERDDPRHADLDLLATHLAALARGEPVHRPDWSFHAHRRTGSTPLRPGPLIVCEGIFALHATVRPAIDVGVYVDAPQELRWARWEHIEASGQRGWGVEHARRYFATVAEPTFARFAAEYRASADLIVINDTHTKTTQTGGLQQ